MLERKTPPELGKVSELKLSEPEKIILANGVPVYVINEGEQDVVKIEVIFKAGSSDCFKEDFLTAYAVNELLDEGTKHHTSAEIAGTFEYYGAVLHTECSADWASVSLFTINKFAEKVFPLFREVIFEPSFPGKEIETYKVQSKQRLQVNKHKVDHVARKTFNEKIFGIDTAYGFSAKAADYNKISQVTLRTFHKCKYEFGIFAIVVAGRVGVGTIKMIEQYFNGWQDKVDRTKLRNSERKWDSDYVERKFHTHKKGAVQSGVRIGKILFNKTHPDFMGMSILNTILGGYFGSRLMSNIREDKGYTYGIGSGLVSLQRSGYFSIATEVGTKVREAALKEIYFEIERLRNDPVPEEELNLVRNYLTGSFQRSMDGPFAQADRLKSVITYNLKYEYFSDYIRTVNTISAKDLLNLAQKYLEPAKMTEVVIG
ncbi:MAG: pitrilysin family protein [Bacteroidia bacterium]